MINKDQENKDQENKDQENKDPENKDQENNIKKNVFSLQNISNYKENLENDCNTIIEKYLYIIFQYLKQITENTKIKNNQHFFFILMKGLDTLYHVFSNILIYTRNLNAAYYNTQKAYYYYIEFIEQINNRNRNSLNLNSKDAIMYVYQKTLFEINNETKMKINIKKEEREIYDFLLGFHKIYKLIFKSFYDKYNINLLLNKNETDEILNHLNITITKINNEKIIKKKYKLNELYDKIIELNENTEYKTENQTNVETYIDFLFNINKIIQNI